MSRVYRTLGCWIGCLVMVGSAFGMGEEQLGNDPLPSSNYTAHPGVMEVINDPHRVYRWWINGNEQFFFRGDSINVNVALAAFAKLGNEPREVLLRPAPGQTSNFGGDQEISFNWKLQMVGGIAGHMRTRDQGSKLWPAHPILTVYIGGPVRLSELEIPQAVEVITLADLKRRYLHGLNSKDQDVRGWTCGKLAELDPHDDETMRAIEAMLKDESQWVRSNAVVALASYGAVARGAKSSLHQASQEGDERLQARVEKTLGKVGHGNANPAAQRRHEQATQAIEDYRQRRLDSDG